MPTAPLTPCNKAGCGELTNNRYCHKHKQPSKQVHHHKREDDRPSACKRGYDHKWRKARLTFLRQNPLCCYCQRKGDVVPATVVDHIIPHRGDQYLFWTQTNWQPLCKRCHDRKTATEDGR